MAYNLAWGSNHPGHLVYLIDLSGSMAKDNKIDDVIDTIAQVSEYLIGMCEDLSTIKNRFSITILGYNSEIVTLFKGSVIDLDKKLDETDGHPMFDKENEAKPQWQTYTANGFRAVAEDIRQWIVQQQSKNIQIPAPIVIHITDGYPYEHERDEDAARKDALKVAEEIKQIAVPDGNTLLFNIHIDKGDVQTLTFPNTRPDDIRRQFLFDASSIMSDLFITRAKGFELPAKEGARFMVSNEKDKNVLAKLIAFGSSMTSLGDSSMELPKL